MTVEARPNLLQPQVQRVDFRDLNLNDLRECFSRDWHLWEGREFNLRWSGAGPLWEFSFVRVPEDHIREVSLYRQSGLVMRLHDVDKVEIDHENGGVRFVASRLMPIGFRKSYKISSGGFYHELKDEHDRTIAIRTEADFKGNLRS